MCSLVPPGDLTNEEKEQIIHSGDFLLFFDRSIRLVERVLAEDTDIFFDYSGRDMEDKEGSESLYDSQAHRFKMRILVMFHSYNYGYLLNHYIRLYHNEKVCFLIRDMQAGSNLSFNRHFYDEHWSKHRVVTSLDWSPQVHYL